MADLLLEKLPASAPWPKAFAQQPPGRLALGQFFPQGCGKIPAARTQPRPQLGAPVAGIEQADLLRGVPTVSN